MAEKRKLAPITILPYDPENLHLSKAQFQEKERKRKELNARMKAFEQTAKAEIEAETIAKKEPAQSTQTIQTEPVPVKEEKPRGRPKSK